MPYFLVETAHLGKIKVDIGGITHEITEHRKDGQSSSSQIVTAYTFKDLGPVVEFQTHYWDSDRREAALLQAREAIRYLASELPSNGNDSGLGIWGITLISYIEDN